MENDTIIPLRSVIFGGGGMFPLGKRETMRNSNKKMRKISCAAWENCFISQECLGRRAGKRQSRGQKSLRKWIVCGGEGAGGGVGDKQWNIPWLKDFWRLGLPKMWFYVVCLINAVTAKIFVKSTIAWMLYERRIRLYMYLCVYRNEGRTWFS